MPYPGPAIYPSASTFPGSFGPSLIPFVTVGSAPRVQVLFPSFATGTVTVTIRRTAEGRTFAVRGGVNLYAVGGASVMDYEPPLGVPSVYQAEQFDVNGLSLGFTDPGSITVSATTALPDTSYAWISQPLNPSLAICASIEMDSASDVARPSAGELFYAEGATVGTWIGSQRRGIVGMKLNVVCDTAADADEFQAMFGSYSTDYPSILCVRSAPQVRIPRVLFASCSEPHEVTEYYRDTRITFQMSVDEVRPPAPGLVLPLLRRKDIDAAFTTRAARAAAYATRLERDTDFVKAGLGG